MLTHPPLSLDHSCLVFMASWGRQNLLIGAMTVWNVAWGCWSSEWRFGMPPPRQYLDRWVDHPSGPSRYNFRLHSCDDRPPEVQTSAGTGQQVNWQDFWVLPRRPWLVLVPCSSMPPGLDVNCRPRCAAEAVPASSLPWHFYGHCKYVFSTSV